jgi:hypothetical protein
MKGTVMIWWWLSFGYETKVHGKSPMSKLLVIEDKESLIARVVWLGAA